MEFPDSVLKYTYLSQSSQLQATLVRERVTAARIETNAIVLGTEEGFVHVLSFSGGLLKSFKAHDRPVNDVSVDNHGLTIASCSDNGTVVVHTIGPEEDKENVIHLSEPLKSVCVEDCSSLKRDKSFIVGGQSGQLTHHRTVWFAQKNAVLFQGADSAVTTIAWRGNFVAWADATQVRLMDISTQTAVCFLEAPSGVGVDSPFPCSLYWEADTDLFVCWADSFRHVELLTAGQHVPGSSRETIARTVTDWMADCIICGVSAFDADYVTLLGYVPPDEDGFDETYTASWGGGIGPSISPSSPATTDHAIQQSHSVGNKVELQLCKRSSGELVSVDTLPLSCDASSGPWQFRLLSTYQCLTHNRDSQRWKLSDVSENRGGARGLCPTLFIIAPLTTDLVVVSNVRDVNDRILAALQGNHLQQAVNLAYADRTSLRYYKYSDLVALYMDELLQGLGGAGGADVVAGSQLQQQQQQQGQAAITATTTTTTSSNNSKKPTAEQVTKIETAARECQRLIGGDAVLWERWVYGFARRRLLRYLALSVPTSSPRLPATVYEVALESLLQSDSRTLHAVVRKWGSVNPPLFDHHGLQARLESHHQQQLQQLQHHPHSRRGGLGDAWLLQTEALLFVYAKQYTKALAAYLLCAVLVNDSGEIINAPVDGGGGSSSSNDDDIPEMQPTLPLVFELVEQHDLFDSVRSQIPALMRLSQDLAAALLVRNLDRLPLPHVVQQLQQNVFPQKQGRRLLHGYLHRVFVAVPEIYNSAEYAAYHEMQVSLYAEFAPSDPGPRVVGKETSFLWFLRTSNFAPLDTALRECERHSPPLHAELVYILSRMGREKEALLLLLREMRDVAAAVQFVQAHPSVPGLWGDLIDHALDHSEFLAGLLDFIGEAEVSPLIVVSRIPPHAQLPMLRQRLLALLEQQGFQVGLHEQCNHILAGDTLRLQRALNQTQRRAVKVEPTWRCVGCARPLFLPPAPTSTATATATAVKKGAGAGVAVPGVPATGSGVQTPHPPLNNLGGHALAPGSVPQIWGAGGRGAASGNGVVVFSNKTVFHRKCLEASMLAGALGPN